MRIVDAHCHIDLMPSMDEFVVATTPRNISLLAVTTTPRAYTLECRKMEKYKNIHVALGLHPQLVAERYDELSFVRQHIQTAKYIGEIGLDFSSRFYHSRNYQQLAFEKILAWCAEYPGKVLSIHAVRADKQVIDAIDRHKVIDAGNTCILHWYSGSFTQLERALKLGCYFSVNSYMASSAKFSEFIRRVPMDKILLESDAPFLNNAKSVAEVFNSLVATTCMLDKLYGRNASEVIYKTSCTMLDFQP